MKIEMPSWFDELAEEEQAGQRVKFLVKLAALFASPQGTLSALSIKCGMSPNSLASMLIGDHRLPAELCVKIENAAGRQFISREMLRPDLFVTPTKG